MDSGVKTAIGTAITGAATDVTSLISTNLPVLLGVTVAFVGVAFAIRWVKKVGRG